jgi:hypothetical protein
MVNNNINNNNAVIIMWLASEKLAKINSWQWQ